MCGHPLSACGVRGASRPSWALPTCNTPSAHAVGRRLVRRARGLASIVGAANLQHFRGARAVGSRLVRRARGLV